MLWFAHPWIFWALAALSVPVLIHLLIRQRPQPIAWAAMRWLEAALKETNRRFRLSHFLLLFLRILLLALIILAFTRPHIVQATPNEQLVLCLDLSASMGPTANGGALAELRENWEEQFGERNIRLIGFGEEVELLFEGPAHQALPLLQQLEVHHRSGGLDRLVENGTETLLDACRDTPHLICLSDFRQDRAETLEELLDDHVSAFTRWRLGKPLQNVVLESFPKFPAPLADQAFRLPLEFSVAPQKILIYINDELLFEQPIKNYQNGAVSQSILIPAQEAGSLQLRLSWEDEGLADDNSIIIPLRVRERIPTLLIDSPRKANDPNFSHIGAALQAAQDYINFDERIHQAELERQALPNRGLIVLNEKLQSWDRIWHWLRDGGMLWARYEDLPLNLPEDIQGDKFPQRKEQVLNGTLLSDMPLLDIPLQRLSSNWNSFIDIELSGTDILSSTENHTRIALALETNDGPKPLVIARSSGRGTLILSSSNINQQKLFWNSGIGPFWTQEFLRSLVEARSTIHSAFQDDPSPIDFQYNYGQSENDTRLIEKGTALNIPNGFYSDKGQDLLILPSPFEHRQDIDIAISKDLASALPDHGKRDLSLFFIILALLVALAEARLASYLGARYVR